MIIRFLSDETNYHVVILLIEKKTICKLQHIDLSHFIISFQTIFL